MLELVIYCILAVAAVAAVIIAKKIQSATFGLYLCYVVLLMALATLHFRPWSIFC